MANQGSGRVAHRLLVAISDLTSGWRDFFFNLQLFVNSGKHYQTEAAGDWLPSYQNF